MYDNVLYHTLKSGEVASVQEPASLDSVAMNDHDLFTEERNDE